MKYFKKTLAFCLTVMLVFTATFAGMTTTAQADEDTVVTIYHTNDMHSDVENLSYVAALKKSTANSILVDAGDATQGQALATYTKGAAIIDLMNAAGYDLMTLGNHEFDYGSAVAIANAAAAKFPVISANVFAEDGSLFLEGINGNNGANYIFEAAGKKIGFFGLTTVETAYKTNPENLNGTVFADEVETARAQVAALQSQGVDAIVAIAHVGNDASSNPTSINIAEQVEGIDVLIDGHSHTLIQETVNGTVVAQTGTQLANIGKITLTFKADGTLSAVAELIDEATYITGAKDETVAALYEAKNTELEPILAEVVGNTTQDLVAYAADGTRLCRIQETSMGDIIADSMVWGARKLVAGSAYEGLPIVSLENGGGVRANIAAGDITIGDVLTVLPFGNMLSVKVVTPQILYNTLENGICKMTVDKNGEVSGLDGRYPQIAGMRFEIDLSKTAYNPDAPEAGTGERVSAIYLVSEDGTETLIDRADTTTEIVLASNNFEIAGGDGYIMLSDLRNAGEGSVLDAVFADYIRELTAQAGGSFTYVADGNRSVVVNTTAAPAEKTEAAKTGDGNAVAVYAVIMMLSAGAFLALRKKSAEEL